MSGRVHLRTLRCSRGPLPTFGRFSCAASCAALAPHLRGIRSWKTRNVHAASARLCEPVRPSVRPPASLFVRPPVRPSARPSVLPLWRCAYMHVDRGRREFNLTPCPNRQSGNTMKQPFHMPCATTCAVLARPQRHACPRTRSKNERSSHLLRTMLITCSYVCSGSPAHTALLPWPPPCLRLEGFLAPLLARRLRRICAENVLGKPEMCARLPRVSARPSVRPSAVVRPPARPPVRPPTRPTVRPPARPSCHCGGVLTCTSREADVNST